MVCRRMWMNGLSCNSVIVGRSSRLAKPEQARIGEEDGQEEHLQEIPQVSGHHLPQFGLIRQHRAQEEGSKKGRAITDRTAFAIRPVTTRPLAQSVTDAVVFARRFLLGRDSRPSVEKPGYSERAGLLGRSLRPFYGTVRSFMNTPLSATRNRGR